MGDDNRKEITFNMTPDPLTPQEMETLQAYITAMKELGAAEPEYLPIESTDWPGQEWEAWNKKCVDLNKEYSGIIIKAITQCLRLNDTWEDSPQSVAAILDALIMGNRPGASPAYHTPTATAIRAESLEYPLDKVNSQIWSLLEKDTGGQIALKAEKSGSKKELSIYYAIDFDEIGQEVTITRRLTPFDKRAYIAISGLFNAGNNIISLTQIYYAMGFTGRPGASDLKRINASITKMTGARIYVNNEQEASAYKYQRFVYDGSLLPLERGTAIVNGQLAEAAIHIFREPPVITFAKQRKQITTIGVDLLQSPISKTDKNLLIDDYLIERISRAKSGKQPRRILLKTLYEKVGVTSSKQKQRMPDKIKRYLSHYQKCGMIETFSIDHEGISFSFK